MAADCAAKLRSLRDAAEIDRIDTKSFCRLPPPPTYLRHMASKSNCQATQIFFPLFSRSSLQIPKIRVRIGEWDFSTTGESHAHVERKVTRKVVHPKYNFFTYENDLALVRLEKKVPFQPNIVPICLPGNDDLLIGKSKPHLRSVQFLRIPASRFQLIRANKF